MNKVWTAEYIDLRRRDWDVFQTKEAAMVWLELKAIERGAGERFRWIKENSERYTAQADFAVFMRVELREVRE